MNGNLQSTASVGRFSCTAPAAIALLFGILGTLLLGRCATTVLPVAGKPHKNSLGMRFVPVPGTPVLFSVYETRVQDFEAFVTATGYRTDGKIVTWKNHRLGEYDSYSWRAPGFDQSKKHPVCAVSWDDAQAFCR